MPTGAGAGVATVGAGSILAGRVFGYLELSLIGVVLVVLVVAAVATTVMVPLRVEVSRTARPARIHVGQDCRVMLAVRNIGRRRTPVLTLRDAVRGTRGVSLRSAPLERGARSAAAYRLPTTRRGTMQVGPLEIELTDPFGLSRTRVTAVGRTSITVRPRIVDLRPPPRRGGAEPHGSRSRGLHDEGEDFHALRPYVVGDDLRHVHWAATARHDDLMVRQLEGHRHGRTTVHLETRAALHVGSSFETAVVAAASILVAAGDRGDELRLVSSGGFDSGIDDDRRHLDAILDWLADVEARTGIEVRPAPGSRPGSVVRVTTDLDPVVRSDPGRGDIGLTVAVITDESEPRRAPGLVSIRRGEDLLTPERALAARRGRFP